MPSAETLTAYLDAAREAARRAAEVLENCRPRLQVREKARADLVTDADLESQRTIREFLGGHFPYHHFLGEEEPAITSRPGPDAPPTWIVDPLDGTTNYVHDCPWYCISIGLHLAGESVVGVILDPSRKEMFSAATGLGAWLNERPLKTSQTKSLGDALMATGFPPDLRGHEQTLQWWGRLSFCTRSLRRTGSTALNIAYVAAGRFDGYWAFDNHPWDVSAGTVIVREAGGMVSNIDGTAFNPFTPDALFSNGPLHAVLVEFFAQPDNAAQPSPPRAP
jgi:myo-inositol-1(or 4)-monophosphatase